jgi:hypothetical protein
MSDLSFIERNKLEKLLEMGGGYVLDFSNRTFHEFVVDSTDKNIDDKSYDYGSCSKANRLRAFWNNEPNHVVGKLIADLLQYRAKRGDGDRLHDECQRIAKRLQEGAPVPDIQAISPNSGGRAFEILAKSVKEAIDKNEPESGLDRLHTFVVKYVRVLCEKHGISAGKDEPLHSVFGKYVRRLKEKGLIESEMTERILKSSISVMEAFNRVRNDKSFAHDNPLLNYDESLFIFTNVASAIRFIAALEKRPDAPKEPDVPTSPASEEIPF